MAFVSGTPLVNSLTSLDVKMSKKVSFPSAPAFFRRGFIDDPLAFVQLNMCNWNTLVRADKDN